MPPLVPYMSQVTKMRHERMDVAPGLDENRVSLLLGVVVRSKRKRASDSFHGAKASKLAKLATVAAASSAGASASSNGGSHGTTPPQGGGSPGVNYIPTARSSKRKDSGQDDAKAGESKRGRAPARSATATAGVAAGAEPATGGDPSSSDDVNDDAPYSPGQLLDSGDVQLAVGKLKKSSELLLLAVFSLYCHLFRIPT